MINHIFLKYFKFFNKRKNAVFLYKLFVFALIFLFLYIFLAFANPQYGKASFYADKFEGRSTASGEKYWHYKLTAAHRTLPFGTMVKVTNLDNNRYTTVKINDRGPFVEGRIIDVSKSAAETLGFVSQGIANVKIEKLLTSTSSPPATNTKPNPQPSKTTNKPQANSKDVYAVSHREFYEFSVGKANPSGYGVQAASFKEAANLARFVEDLKRTYQQRVFVQVVIVKQVKFYRVLLGNFNDNKSALQLQARLKSRYPDCFIVNYKAL